MRRFFACCVVAALALPLSAEAAAPEAAGTNLLSNPSFEAGPDKDLPKDWSGSPKIFSLDGSVARTGKVSLKCVNPDAARYELIHRMVSVQPGWKVRLRLWVKTENVAGDDSGATACLEWNDRNGRWLGGLYPTGVKGTSDWKQVEGAIRIPENATNIRLSCYLRKGNTGTAWFDDLELFRVADPPMHVTLLTPVYRGRIDPAGLQEARFRVQLNLADYDITPRDVRIVSEIVGKADSKVYGKDDFAPGRETSERAVSLQGLKPGDYILNVSIRNADRKVLQTWQHPIASMPDDFRPKCTIDSHRRLLVDGKPFFPIGMYWGDINEKELSVYAQSKFNCLMPYASPDRSQMDLAAKHGLKVIYSVKDSYAGTPACISAIKTEADEESWVRSRVREFRDHPALLAWYLNDELPESCMPRLEAHQRWVSEGDPHHPTWVVLYQFNEVGAYIRTFDVIGTDPYPIDRTPASTAGVWTAETLRQVGGSRPLWQVPQVFNWGNYGHTPEEKRKGRTPTFDEMRSMTWQCIAEGAMGLVFYSWFDIRRNPDVPFDVQWDRLKQIAAEVDRTSPVLLSIEPVPAVKIEASAGNRPAWLHPLVKRHQGKLYLIAVNDGDGEDTIRYALPAAPRSVREVNENRTIPVAGSGFQDRSAKLSVKIYEIDEGK